MVSGRFALYSKIVRFIERLQKNGIIVLSPKPSKISESIKDFLLLESDMGKTKGISKGKIPSFLERKHCEHIKEADYLIIYNPDGKDGTSMLSEIGVAFGAGKPIYSIRPIQELPFRDFTTVISQKELIKLLTQKSS